MAYGNLSVSNVEFGAFVRSLYKFYSDPIMLREAVSDLMALAKWSNVGVRVNLVHPYVSTALSNLVTSTGVDDLSVCVNILFGIVFLRSPLVGWLFFD